jgi:hypothetical protein
MSLEGSHRACYPSRPLGVRVGCPWRGAVTLSPFEAWLLGECVERLPNDFQPAVRDQLAGSNLVQRDPQWRELRFYRIVRGRVDRSALPLAAGEARGGQAP